MTETKIGTVTHYYNHLHVAGVAITDGELHKGDTIHVKGHTSDFEQKVESMEIDNEAVEVAKPCQFLSRSLAMVRGCFWSRLQYPRLH